MYYSSGRFIITLTPATLDILEEIVKITKYPALFVNNAGDISEATFCTENEAIESTQKALALLEEKFCLAQKTNNVEHNA